MQWNLLCEAFDVNKKNDYLHFLLFIVIDKIELIMNCKFLLNICLIYKDLFSCYLFILIMFTIYT